MRVSRMANHVVSACLEGQRALQAIWEDRIDDLVKRFPRLRLNRDYLGHIAEFDPSQNKKYLPWIIKQWADGKFNLTPGQEAEATLDHLRDQLMTFERLLVIPAFNGARDIFAYDWKKFDETMTQNMDLQSKSEQQRTAHVNQKKKVVDYERLDGVKKVGESGDITALAITNPESLAWYGWQAYKKENPNWGKPTIEPPENRATDDPYNRDYKWCIRNISRGLNYIRGESIAKAFILVLKKGWPYVGILLGQGQAKNLDNEHIDMGVAEEIYPALKPVIDAFKKKGGRFGSETEIFDDLRIVQGRIEPGEVFGKTVKLQGSTISKLPPNCTFNGTLNIRQTKITELPEGTTIKGKLLAGGSALRSIHPSVRIEGDIELAGTQITELPPGTNAKSVDISYTPIKALPSGLDLTQLNIVGTPIMELPIDMKVKQKIMWSKPMTLEQIKIWFFHKCNPTMLKEWMKHPKLEGKDDEYKLAAWKASQPRMLKHFYKNPEINKVVTSNYIEEEPKGPPTEFTGGEY